MRAVILLLALACSGCFALTDFDRRPRTDEDDAGRADAAIRPDSSLPDAGTVDAGTGDPDSGLFDAGTEPAVLVAAPASLVEGGDAGTLTLTLVGTPTDPVTIALSADDQLATEDTELVLDADTPSVSTDVRALFDGVDEGPHEGTLSFDLRSDDARYELALEDATVSIEDRTSALVLVSVALDGDSANGDSGGTYTRNADIDGDGSHVAFVSRANDLVPDAAAVDAVYLRDLDAGETIRISESPDGADPDGVSDCVSLSDDATRVAFRSSATNLTDSPTSGVRVFLWEAGEGIRELGAIPDSGPCPFLSGDGGHLSFPSDIAPPGFPTATNDRSDVYRIALDGDELLQVNTTSSGAEGLFGPNGANAFAGVGNISTDGRWVGFSSYARALASPDITTDGSSSYVKTSTPGPSTD